jgi:glycosyltransferase involved in cell wall biosynthesis
VSGARRLLFVSPHFPPDSAAATHRARILAPHLPKFGWQPLVLTVDDDSIEGERDPELADSCRGIGRVVRVRAWPATRTRRLGFGDLGLRSYAALRRAAVALAAAEPVAATIVTTYPIYPAVIGAALKRSRGIPFVLDLQDPWVGAWGKDTGPGGAPDLRSRASRWIARRLERRVATAADAFMSVSLRTLRDVVVRVPDASRVPHLEVPIGWEPADWRRVRGDGRPNGLFQPDDGCVHVCAVGTVLPTSLDGVRMFLCALRRIADEAPLDRRVRVWFVGTSNQRLPHVRRVVYPLAVAAGVDRVVEEVPERAAYFDALRILRDAHVVLVMGSDEPHYSPSRVFPALASRRPVIARLHRASPAWPLLEAAAASRPVALVDATGDEATQVSAWMAALREMLACARESAADDAVLAPFAGEALAADVARLLDRITAR